jgi:hypothetical protein
MWAMRSGFGALLLAGIACACNPFDGFAECDYRNRDVEPGEVVEGVDVDAKIASLLQEHSGTITWLQLGGPRHLTIALERPTEAKAQLETDCDAQLEGFSVELVTRVASEDGLADAFGSASLQLDKKGEAKPFASTKRKYPLDFDQLKAAGATPDTWVSNFSPYLVIDWERPQRSPTAGDVSADHGEGGKQHTVLATITFP